MLVEVDHQPATLYRSVDKRAYKLIKQLATSQKKKTIRLLSVEREGAEFNGKCKSLYDFDLS